jgi:hypothetical protein
VIEHDLEHPECRSESRTPPFPVTYGSPVPCYRTVVGPHSIGRTALYRIESSGIRRGSGYFRYEPYAGGGLVTNLSWEDVAAQVSSWPSLREPSSNDQGNTDQINSNTNAAPAAAETNAVSANKP